MIIIQEFLPNPTGKDTKGEWIKLFNSGNKEVNLVNWQIKDASGKTFVFDSFNFGPNEFLILDHQSTKIFLNNNGETIFLFDENNNLIDQLGFSWMATNDEIITKNAILKGSDIGLVQNQAEIFPIINPSSQSVSNFDFLLIGLAICLVLSFLFMVIIKHVRHKE